MLIKTLKTMQHGIYNEEHGTTSKKPKTAPQLVDISSWFEASQFLDNLKPYINKMFGRRFLAFSTPDGHVYFQAKVLEEVAPIKGYYTPFHAEPFGSIAEMEHAKPQMLRDIIKVSPYLDNDNSKDEN